MASFGALYVVGGTSRFILACEVELKILLPSLSYEQELGSFIPSESTLVDPKLCGLAC